MTQFSKTAVSYFGTWIFMILLFLLTGMIFGQPDIILDLTAPLIVGVIAIQFACIPILLVAAKLLPKLSISGFEYHIGAGIICMLISAIAFGSTVSSHMGAGFFNNAGVLLLLVAAVAGVIFGSVYHLISWLVEACR